MFLQIFDCDFGDWRQALADARVGDYHVEDRNIVSGFQICDGDRRVDLGGAVDPDDYEGAGTASWESIKGLGSGIVGIANRSNYGSFRSCKIDRDKATANP